jgi:hypothetical protein
MSASRVNVTIESITKTQKIPILKNPRNVGDLVYSYRDVPKFTAKNNRGFSLETDSSSSSEENSKTQTSNDPWKSQSSGKLINTKDQDDSGEFSWKESKRTSRSLQAKIAASGRRSSSSSSGSEENEQEPGLQLDSAPCMPLIPFFVGIQGSKIRASKQFDPVQTVVKLATKIGSDLENPGSLVDHNTLSKFSLMTLVLRAMDSKQIEEAARTLEPFYPKNPNRNDNTKWGAW